MGTPWHDPAVVRDGPPDDILVAHVLDGDRGAYSVLVLRHQEGLFRYARGMGVDREAARDLMQEAFIQAYRKLRECREPARFEAWLFRILRNRCLDHLKDVRRGHEPLDDLELTDDSVDPASDAARAELRDQLEAALAGLGTELRDAFLMKHLEERSYQEMAELADASVSAMKMRVHRARAALQDLLPEPSAADAGVTFRGARSSVR